MERDSLKKPSPLEKVWRYFYIGYVFWYIGHLYCVVVLLQLRTPSAKGLYHHHGPLLTRLAVAYAHYTLSQYASIQVPRPPFLKRRLYFLQYVDDPCISM